MKYGFWNDLSKRLFDASASSWIHALPVGKYEHPVYGSLDFTPDKIQAFAQSVTSKVRGIDPDIDYDHKEQGGKAAGWVKNAEVRNDGLYLQVDWTEPAAQAIKNGEYRYFSPEFDDEWTDAQGNKHENVLFGGALTNRPFLKDLLPVNLSEITTKQPQGGKLDPKMLRIALKLSETATDDEVIAAITKLSESSAGPKSQSGPPVDSGLNPDALTKMLGDLPVFKKLQESLDTAQKQLAESERQRQLSDTRHKLSSLQTSQGGRKYVLPPAVVDSISEGTVTGDPVKMSEAFLKGLEALTRTGFVELGERGRQGPRTEKDATQQLAEQVATVRANHFKATGKTLSYTDAVRATVRNSPELYEEYRQDSYAGKEDK